MNISYLVIMTSPRLSNNCLIPMGRICVIILNIGMIIIASMTLLGYQMYDEFRDSLIVGIVYY